MNAQSKDFTLRFLAEWFCLFVIIGGVLWMILRMAAPHRTEPWHLKADELKT